MPELPEVETIVRDLNLKVLKRTFIDVWIGEKKLIKRPKNFNKFKNLIKGRKIKRISRRGKNIIFELSDDFMLLVHQKMTGHFLIGNWKLFPPGRSHTGREIAYLPAKQSNWEPLKRGLLNDPVNRYIHLMFWLDNGFMLALSDLRKFAKVELWKKEELLNSKEFRSLGPEPLDKNFTFEKFKEILQKKRGKIKQILMDQKTIVGIGNIYSDEILWRAKIHPLKDASELNENQLKAIYDNIKKVLELAIKLRGESISDFRDLKGNKGMFDQARKVYRREGEKCFRCGSKIKRLKIGGRSAHFCPSCQKI
jgi:formamidopyrimidine-DNA glycosylase